MRVSDDVRRPMGGLGAAARVSNSWGRGALGSRVEKMREVGVEVTRARGGTCWPKENTQPNIQARGGERSEYALAERGYGGFG